MSAARPDTLSCMVIDDDVNIRNIISGFLRKRGHKVSDFSTASEALTQLVSQHPDIVLVDWMMPGMDGIAFLAELDRHSVNFRPVTIMVTAKNDETAIKTAIDRGFDDFLHKPFTLSTLAVRLAVAEKQAHNRRRLLELKRQADEQANYVKTLSRNICAGILLIDLHTHEILYCNQFASELIGLPQQEITGRICHNFICPREVGSCPISDLRMSLNRRQAVLLKADHTERTIMKTAEITSFNGTPAILETFVDVNDLFQAQQAMHDFTRNIARMIEERAQNVQQKLRESLPDAEATNLAQEIGACLLCADTSIQLVDQYWNITRDLIAFPSSLPPEEQDRFKAIICGMDEALCAAGNSLSRTSEILRWPSPQPQE